MIDTHTHINCIDDFSIDEILKNASDNGVEKLIVPSAYASDIDIVAELASKYENVYGLLGVHPSEVKDWTDDLIDKIKECAKSPKIVGIGEIGLDYYWDENPPREVQQEVFRKHMKLAEELNMPVIIHDREAHEDTLKIMKEFPSVIGVVHCFSGSVEFAKECLRLGYYIGITGVVTFKNSKKVKEVVKEVPLDRLLVETDCPYMAPEPNRGKRNKSSYIKYVLDKIVEIKEIDSLELNKIVNNNLYTLMKKIKK